MTPLLVQMRAREKGDEDEDKKGNAAAMEPARETRANTAHAAVRPSANLRASVRS